MTHHVSTQWMAFAVMLLKMVYCLPGNYDQFSTPSMVYGHSRQIPTYSQSAENGTPTQIITPTNIYSNTVIPTLDNNPCTEQYQKILKLDDASNAIQSIQTNQPNFHPSSFIDSTQRYTFKTPFDIFPSFFSPEARSTPSKILNTGHSLSQSTFAEPQQTYSTSKTHQVPENFAKCEPSSTHELEKPKMFTDENHSITAQTIINLLQHFQNMLKQNHSDSKELSGVKHKSGPSSFVVPIGSTEATPLKNSENYQSIKQLPQTRNLFRTNSLTGHLPQSQENISNGFLTNTFTKTSMPPAIASYTYPKLGLNDSKEQWLKVNLGEQNIPETNPVSIQLGDQSNFISTTTEKTQSYSSASSIEKQNGFRSCLAEEALHDFQPDSFAVPNVMFGVGNQQVSSNNHQGFTKSLTTVPETHSTSTPDTNSSIQQKSQECNILLSSKQNGYNALSEQCQQANNFPTSTVGYNIVNVPANLNHYDKYLAQQYLPDKQSYIPTPQPNLGYNYAGFSNAVNVQTNNLNVPFTEQNIQDRQQRLFSQNMSNKIRQNYANIGSILTGENSLTNTFQNTQQYLPTMSHNNFQESQVNYPTNLQNKVNYNFLRTPNKTPQDVQNYLSASNQLSSGYSFTSVPRLNGNQKYIEDESQASQLPQSIVGNNFGSMSTVKAL